MTIELYYNNSEKNAVDKYIVPRATLNGEIKKETSIIEPTVLIEGDVLQMIGANYAYIPEFNRFYFITNITVVRNNLYQISCHCDVLTTYKNAIRNNTAIIKKQANAWNLYLDDGTFRTYQNRKIVLKKFPNGFSGHSYILLVAGS